MEPNTDRLIEEQFKILPLPLQRAIALTAWKNLVSDIAKNNNLAAEQARSLETETMLVMYGFESVNDLGKNIARELAIDPGRASMIGEEVGIKILSVVVAKAEELGKQQGDTLQTVAVSAPITPAVLTPEPRTFEPKDSPNNPPINVLPPEPKEEGPLELLPPKAAPVKIENEPPLKAVSQAYPNGIDPYREPIK